MTVHLTVAIIIVFVNKKNFPCDFREVHPVLATATMNNISIERANYRGNKPVQQANRNRDEELLRKSGKLDVYYIK